MTNTETNLNTPPEVAAQPANPAHVWEVVVGSFVGGAFLTIADLIFNKSNSITGKIVDFVTARNMIGLGQIWLELIAFGLMIGLGLGLCFVYRPQTRFGAFTRGSSVIAVLTGMNISATLMAGEAIGQQLMLRGNVDVAIEKPQAYGPLGLGTLLNGDSNAHLKNVPITGMISVNCKETLKVGREDYCPVDVEQLDAGVREQLQPAGQQIWFKK
ncbi:hypothetical protein GCM10008927_19430 [Amylibacter ulvae]|uniref:Uncharacterized protein n=1 Tax=Paramylibacter ulvae TaxID=1651968 RepID=A0ABQ3D6W1_9RHOB|nr:hypothetical protein [Amylibacter ulvae]GHA53679.1 hypothetical protein GCM10008927_19430 [Amylibacter ulvae]